MARDTKIEIRLTGEEKAELQRRAGKEKLGPWMRRFCLRIDPDDLQPWEQEHAAALAEVDGDGLPNDSAPARGLPEEGAVSVSSAAGPDLKGPLHVDLAKEYRNDDEALINERMRQLTRFIPSTAQRRSVAISELTKEGKLDV